MRLFRLGLVLVPALILSGPATLVARADDAEDVWKELVEKIKKAFKKSEEAQRKATAKAAKRAREEKEDRTEAQQEAREKADKDRREASRKIARAGHDTTKLEEEALDELEDLVEHYVKRVHRAALKQVGSLPDPATPEQAQAHQRAMAEAIKALRPQAKPGDLFLPEVQPIIKKIIADELAGRAGAPARQAILGGNPPGDPDRDDRMQVKLAVNAPYPAAAALSTVPPSVLLTLPLLKKEVEYRFVGRDLILLDVEANMILDYIRAAAPPLTVPAAAPRR
jgi:hypothetical protein